jgi:hypothetical protein
MDVDISDVEDAADVAGADEDADMAGGLGLASAVVPGHLPRGLLPSVLQPPALAQVLAWRGLCHLSLCAELLPYPS